ncbi:hypothetical protein [Thalassotalea crassostreae]|uniref:hypothetical protein n=1 Tax=Thalassotalea crassostreae TaxID=1763536 RepID=UPI00083850B9|nr:hypothetical protein [Thalassotalea crassostreae]
MRRLLIKILALTGLFFSSFTMASPTENEFIPCKKIAVAMLESCLQHDDGNCWVKSETAHNSCRTKVIDSHKVDQNRVNAEKNAAAKRAAEIEQHKANNDI